MRVFLLAGLSLLTLASCNGTADAVIAGSSSAAATFAQTRSGLPFQVQEIAKFKEPWAMTFLQNSPWLLITEKPGTLRIVNTTDGRVGSVSGLPKVSYGGQGGLGDVLIHPADKRLVYVSYVEAGEGDLSGAAVGRGRMDCAQPYQCHISDFKVIWRQAPKVEGRGHYGHRLAFGPDGKLYISNGDRQKFDPAQDLTGTLGKVVRINDDGSVPTDNPWASRGGATAQLWTLGHRNILGLAFNGQGQLWSHEMGPKGGDEFNLIERGSNYGYPIVSNGAHYDGRDIPDHSTRPEFNAPEITWNEVSPAGLMIYSGSLFPRWRGNAFLGGLSGQTLIRVAIDGNTAREAERWPMNARIREVEQGPDGAIYVLEDERNGSGGRLLRLAPAR
jgi:glucose/arabinose dehydrogenase